MQTFVEFVQDKVHKFDYPTDPDGFEDALTQFKADLWYDVKEVVSYPDFTKFFDLFDSDQHAPENMRGPIDTLIEEEIREVYGRPIGSHMEP